MPQNHTVWRFKPVHWYLLTELHSFSRLFGGLKAKQPIEWVEKASCSFVGHNLRIKVLYGPVVEYHVWSNYSSRRLRQLLSRIMRFVKDLRRLRNLGTQVHYFAKRRYTLRISDLEALGYQKEVIKRYFARFSEKKGMFCPHCGNLSGSFCVPCKAKVKEKEESYIGGRKRSYSHILVRQNLVEKPLRVRLCLDGTYRIRSYKDKEGFLLHTDAEGVHNCEVSMKYGFVSEDLHTDREVELVFSNVKSGQLFIQHA